MTVQQYFVIVTFPQGSLQTMKESRDPQGILNGA